MRAIAFVTDLIDKDEKMALDLKRVFVHAVSDEEVMRQLGVSSKLNADWALLTDLRDRGRQRADEWLRDNYTSIGKRSSVDIRERYL